MATTFSYLLNPIFRRDRLALPLTTRIAKAMKSQKKSSLASFKAATIRSARGQQIQGYFIVADTISPKKLQPYEKEVLDTIAAASRLAKSLGAGILGLDQYSSLVADKHQAILKNFGIPITSGNAFSAWTVFEGMYHMSILKNIDFKTSRFVIMDATTAIGSLCARKLSEYVSRLTLVSSQREKLLTLQEAIRQLHAKEAAIHDDPRGLLKDADMVILTGYADQGISIREFKSGAFICDATVFKTMLQQKHTRSDITLIDAGIVSQPFKISFIKNRRLPPQTIDASLAETLLLALENKTINYSLGENVNLDKLEEIANIATRHSFEVWIPG